jgi:cytochrome c biogenesis protein CcdA
VLALALSAGMLGAVNPCGFALLPAYLSVLVAGETGGPAAAVGRAVRCSAALTLGYVAVFGTFGLVLTPLAGTLTPRLPWLTVLLGAALAVAGAWLLAGRSLPVPGRGLPAPRLTGSVASTVLFGMAYAVASLGCAIGPFLAIVVSGLRSGSVLPFLAYAAGMGLVIGVTAVAVALARASLLSRLRRVSAVVPRLGGAVLLVTGGYVAWYGGYELRLAGDRRVAGTDPVVNAAGDLQRWLSALVGRTGPVLLIVLLAALILITPAAARRRTPAPRP